MATEVLFQNDVKSEEIEGFHVCLQPRTNGEQLLGNNWQYFNVDTIELVETGPGTLLAKTWEQALHHLVVNLVRTIEHDT